MATLNFNEIEWEINDNPISQRYAEFLKDNIEDTNQFFYMGETETQIKDEIDGVMNLQMLVLH